MTRAVLQGRELAPSPHGGEGWGEGVLSLQISSDAEPPHPTLSPQGRGFRGAAR
jgi:hypothetical protein